MKITKEELAQLYTTLTQAELRKQLGGIHTKGLYKLLDEAGIPRKMPRRSDKIELVD